MSNSKFIYGLRKVLIDFRLFRRVYCSAIKEFGFLRAFREINIYLRNPKCLFRSTPNRYLKSKKEIIAVPDMPPLNSKVFIDYVIKDIQWINHGKTPNPVFAIVCITSKCPFKCKYCYNSDLHTAKETLSVDTIKNVIDQLVKHGIKSIYLSGGEPLTRWNELLELLDQFKNTGTRFWMLSTGYGLNREKLDILKSKGLKGVMISLDSLNENQINTVKENENAFSYAINAIKEANKAGLIVALDSVFGKTLLKEKDFEEFIDFTGNLGAHFINCYSPKQMHHILDGEYQQFGLAEFKTLSALIIKNHRESKFKSLPITYSPDLWEAKRGCVGGKLFIYIDPAGNVKKCPFIQKSFGNIKNKTIKDILNNSINIDDEYVCSTNKLLQTNNTKF